MLLTVKMAHAQFKPNPASLEIPEKWEAGACLIINMWDLWTAHLAFHTLFFLIIKNFNLHENIFVAESALNLNM